MAFFKNNPKEWERLDYRIFQNGWASLYLKESVLNTDILWFKKENFKVSEFDCSSWTNLDNIHQDLKTQLSFPDFYGENFDALNDCLADIEIPDSGLLFVFREFQSIEREIAHNLLDIFSNNSRRHMLFGKKLLTLVQVNDPSYRIDVIGACPVLWNNSEWLNSSRGL